MESQLEQARQLKQALIEFTLNTEGQWAESLERFVAQKSRTLENRYDATYQNNLLVDSFLTEGNVDSNSPINIFIEQHPELSENDRALLLGWKNSFISLFEVKKILSEGFELKNWLTTKSYVVKPNDPATLEEMGRLKQGEILLTRIAPVTNDYWMFSGPCIPLGRLGKPKLAVAIGNFKKDHSEYLYSDAPDLLEEAWQSVEKYHQEFLDFFGENEITLSGYELNKKVSELQEMISKKILVAAGVNESKSFAEIAKETGMTEDEVQTMAQQSGAGFLENAPSNAKMAMPKAQLPDSLKKAPEVTALSHPRWGQMYLPNYRQLQALLEVENGQNIGNAQKLVDWSLQDSEMNTYVWQKLAQQYPQQLEKLLQTVLERPNFQIQEDLETLLQEYDKPLEPDLPETASVPLHLHNLFQEAFTQVSKSKKTKGKKKPKSGRGFS